MAGYSVFKSLISPGGGGGVGGKGVGTEGISPVIVHAGRGHRQSMCNVSQSVAKPVQQCIQLFSLSTSIRCNKYIE